MNARNFICPLMTRHEPPDVNNFGVTTKRSDEKAMRCRNDCVAYQTEERIKPIFKLGEGNGDLRSDVEKLLDITVWRCTATDSPWREVEGSS